jgi:hypothetical protein
MKKYDFTSIEKVTKPPYFVGDSKDTIDFSTNSLIDILKFEPVDILNGASYICDSEGRQIEIRTDSEKVIFDNEYPKKLENIYIVLRNS